MQAVVLTGSAGALGRRVLDQLCACPGIGSVLGVDVVDPTAPVPPGATTRTLDLGTDDLVALFEGADTVVHLASVLAPASRDEDAGRDLELTRRVVDAARRCSVGSVVLMSSATVYGAWPDNPVPLTEEAPLRPNPGFGFAREKVAIERLAGDLRTASPSTAVAVLRPTVTLAEGERSWVSQVLASAAGVHVGDIDPPVQFLHFDDLASATVLAARERLDGVYNVAPDGWIPPDAMRGFATLPRPRVPVWVADQLTAARFRLGLSATPPEILPWTIHPWVVANDRLRAEGWEPASTNEEAYVAGTAPGPLDTLSPKRRQEIALAVAAGLVVAAGVGAVELVRRRTR
jgi:nucleoside-diphosphate-sugar epimerase